jgi:hypothetical protein
MFGPLAFLNDPEVEVKVNESMFSLTFENGIDWFFWLWKIRKMVYAFILLWNSVGEYSKMGAQRRHSAQQN